MMGPLVTPVQNGMAKALKHMPLGMHVHSETSLKLVDLEYETPTGWVMVVVCQVGVAPLLFRRVQTGSE